MSRFYICPHCGNLVGVIKSSGVPIVCCGEEMQQIVANTTEASKEKHLPEVKREGNVVHVKVGSVAHPMLIEHHIQWIYLETRQGGQRKQPIDLPECDFALTADDEPLAVYAFCNLHGLWKTEL